MKNTLVCDNLTVCHGSKIAVDRVGFSLDDSTLTVLLGLNGSGKSTLLRAIAGLTNYSGSIRILGDEVRSTDRAVRAKRLALLTQHLPAPDFTIRELVSCARLTGARAFSHLSQDDRAIVDESISEVGLADFGERTVKSLSGGERQRAFFAMALAQRTELILLDEPSAHLDPRSSAELCELLASRKSHGKTLLCVLHDLNLALAIADRILVLDSGRLVFDGTPESLVESGIPESLFGLRRFDADGRAVYLVG